MINTREIAEEYRLSHWLQIMQERTASGLSIISYCKSIGIRPNVYHYWQKKLREAAVMATSQNRSTPKSNDVIGSHALPTRTAPQGWAICETKSLVPSQNTIQIEIGKSRVTADTGTNMDLLCEVCRMLMTLC